MSLSRPKNIRVGRVTGNKTFIFWPYCHCVILCNASMYHIFTALSFAMAQCFIIFHCVVLYNNTMFFVVTAQFYALTQGYLLSLRISCDGRMYFIATAIYYAMTQCIFVTT